MQGGGSLLGVDLEFLLTQHFGIQIGGGFVGYGGGINYHFKPSIRSSFISVQYWHQGIGTSHVQTIIGPNYVFRSRRLFTFQAGLGIPIEEGPASPASYVQPPVILMYAVGLYFPFNE